MTDTVNSYLSATALAKKHNITVKEMFVYLTNKHLIEKRGDVWSLTNEGIAAGGKFITGKQFGKYIVWPEDLQLDVQAEKLISLPAIAKHFSMDKEVIIEILEKIEWIYRVPNGFLLLPKGQEAGGMEDSASKTEQLTIRWPLSVVENDELQSVVKSLGGRITEKHCIAKKLRNSIVEATCTEKYRCLDGHFVANEAEAIVDNYLYQKQLAHGYHFVHQGKSNLVSTFFLPGHNLFIDILEASTSDKRAKEKREFYKAKKISFLELTEKETENVTELLSHLIDEDQQP